MRRDGQEIPNKISNYLPNQQEGRIKKYIRLWLDIRTIPYELRPQSRFLIDRVLNESALQGNLVIHFVLLVDGVVKCVRFIEGRSVKTIGIDVGTFRRPVCLRVNLRAGRQMECAEMSRIWTTVDVEI